MAEQEAAASPSQNILVMGSAGKGSIGTMIAALIRACGLGVAHLDTHFLHSPLERLTLNGAPLSPAEVERLAGSSGPQEEPAEAQRLDTLFEAAIQRAGPAWVVRGGVPAANERIALVTFAPILPSEALGAGDAATTLLDVLPQAEVAVSTLQRESALEVLRTAYPQLHEVAQRCRLSRGRADLDGQEFRLKTDQAEYRLRLPVLGPFQVENAATAILSVEQLAPAGVRLAPDAAREALAAIRLPGRLEVLKQRPLVIVDICTSIATLRRVVEGLRGLTSGHRLQLILGGADGLGSQAAIEMLTPLTPEILATPPTTESARRELTDACYEAGLPLRFAPSVDAATDEVLRNAQPGDAMVVLGSRESIASARALILGLLPPQLRPDYTG